LDTEEPELWKRLKHYVDVQQGDVNFQNRKLLQDCVIGVYEVLVLEVFANLATNMSFERIWPQMLDTVEYGLIPKCLSCGA